MKLLISMFLIFAVMVSCTKDTNLVTITIKDKHTGLMLPDFSYKITTHGLGGMQSEVRKTGIVNGFTSFNYNVVKRRNNELEMHSDSVKGYFPKYGHTKLIGEKNRDFVFEFISFKYLKIVVTNTSCLNANDKISVAVQKQGPNPGADHVSSSGCLDHYQIYNEALSAGMYKVSWTITRDSGTTHGNEIVELTELKNEIFHINY